MMPDLDIYRAAQALIQQHGADAGIQAAIKADKFVAAGDLDGAAMWRRILGAIKELIRTTPGPWGQGPIKGGVNVEFAALAARSVVLTGRRRGGCYGVLVNFMPGGRPGISTSLWPATESGEYSTVSMMVLGTTPHPAKVLVAVEFADAKMTAASPPPKSWQWV